MRFRLMTDIVHAGQSAECYRTRLTGQLFLFGLKRKTMKRVRCPKCDSYIIFDETRYKPGQSLAFECGNCHRQFSIRMGANRIAATGMDCGQTGDVADEGFGIVEVIENVFGYRQVFALHEGNNVIGRYNKGDFVDIPIRTTDRSMDRRHCVISVKREMDGSLSHSLHDYPSLTGTYLYNRILGDRESALMEDGAVVTLGATTLIFRCSEE